MQRGLLARRWAPSLLVRFGVVSFALLATAAVVLAGEVRELRVERALHDARSGAIDTAQLAIQPQLATADLARDFVPLDAARLTRLDHAARSALSPAGVVGITIWNLQHWIVYSDDPELIGRWTAPDDQLVAALDGATSSEVTAPDPEHGSEERHGELLEVYAPLRAGADGELTTAGTGEVVGVIEVHTPYAPLAAAIAADARAVHTWVAVGFVVLHLGLFLLVRRATRRRRPAVPARLHVIDGACGRTRVDEDALDEQPAGRRALVEELRGAVPADALELHAS